MTQGSLSTRLRVLRAERGLTLRDAASLTGLRPGTLSELERGLRHPHDITLSRIAKGYGVPVEDLLEAEEAEELPEASYGGERFEQYLVEARGKSRDELMSRYVELDDRLKALSSDPATLPRKLGGQSSPEELGRHFREMTEAAAELRAIGEVLRERPAKHMATLAKV